MVQAAGRASRPSVGRAVGRTVGRMGGPGVSPVSGTTDGRAGRDAPRAGRARSPPVVLEVPRHGEAGAVNLTISSKATAQRTR